MTTVFPNSLLDVKIKAVVFRSQIHMKSQRQLQNAKLDQHANNRQFVMSDVQLFSIT